MSPQEQDAIALESMARTIHSWLCWTQYEHEKEGIPISDDTAIIADPPEFSFPHWPSYRALELWRDTLLRLAVEKGADEMRPLPRFYPTPQPPIGE